MALTAVLQRTALAFAMAVVSIAGSAATSVTADEAQRNLVLQTAAPAARKEQRLALVIGNAAYKEAPLTNPVNDAQAMAKALESAGFTVLLQTDVDHRALLAAVRDFGNRLRQGGFGVFYYAGHGMQIKGRNYLIPIGADIQREDEVAYAGLDAQAVLDKMEAAANGSNLMILDACRNNPFARSFRSSVQGLAQMEAPVGTLVAFSTAPGSVASDGQGANGLYTQHLLTAMRTPGAKVEDVFKQVRAGVRKDSQGKQVPWESTSLEGDLYFVDPVAVEPPPKLDTAKAVEEGFWDAVKNSKDPADVRAYLGRYPKGEFAPAARARLAALAPAPAATATTAPSVTAPSMASQQVVAPATKPPPLPVATVAATLPAVASQQALVPVTTSPQLPAATLALASSPVASQQVTTPLTKPPPPAVTTVALATPPVVVLAPAASTLQPPLGSPATTPPGSARGYSVGDKWSFQLVDKWKGEVVRNVTEQVVRIGPAGEAILADDADYRAPWYRFSRLMLEPALAGQPAMPGRAVWWEDMKAGDKRQLAFKTEVRRFDGRMVPADVDVTIVRKGPEKIRVPAGEFEAIRLECTGNTGAFLSPASPRALIRWDMTLWYVPALHFYAATELVSLTNTSSPYAGGGALERLELTSFELRDGLLAIR